MEILVFLLKGIKLQINRKLEKDQNEIKNAVFVTILVYMYCNEIEVEPLMSFIEWWAVEQFGKYIKSTETDNEYKVKNKYEDALL